MTQGLIQTPQVSKLLPTHGIAQVTSPICIKPELVVNIAQALATLIKDVYPGEHHHWERLDLATRLIERFHIPHAHVQIWPGAYQRPYWLTSSTHISPAAYFLALGNDRPDDAVTGAMLLAYHIHRWRSDSVLPAEGIHFWHLPRQQALHPTLAAYRLFAYLLLDF